MVKQIIKQSRWLFAGIVPSTVLLIGACTVTTPRVISVPGALPEVDSVAIISKGITTELDARFDRESAKSGAKTGLGSGMAGGAAAALACGPFYLLCALGTIPAGMAVGTVTGAATGQLVDDNWRPTTQQLEQLEELVEKLGTRRTLHEELALELEKLIPPDRLDNSVHAAAKVQLKLSDVRLTQDTGNNFTLGLAANLTMQWYNSAGRLKSEARVYDFNSRAEPFGYWIEKRGANLEQTLDSCVDGLAREINNDFRYKPR